jgi:hypothetical protein
LVGVPKNQLLADVEEFATSNGLTDLLAIFRKGALIAQNPGGFETIEELDSIERETLRTEATKRWAQTRTLYLTIILNSIAAAIQGWDQTGSPCLHYHQARLINPPQVQTVPICHSLPILALTMNPPHAKMEPKIKHFVKSGHGSLALSMPVRTSASAFCRYLNRCFGIPADNRSAGWLSDPLNNLFGRRITIFIGAIFSLLSPIGSGLTRHWGQLVACRILLGVGNAPLTPA